jgi:hypothetical protein
MDRATALGWKPAACNDKIATQGFAPERWRFMLAHGFKPRPEALLREAVEGSAERVALIAPAVSALPDSVDNQYYDPFVIDAPSAEVVKALQLMLEKAPTLLAAYKGDAAALGKATDVDKRVLGWTPLAVALVRGNDVAAQALLERGAKIEMPYWAKKPLFYAALKGSEKTVRAVVAKVGPVALMEKSQFCCMSDLYRPPVVAYRGVAKTAYDEKQAQLYPLHAAALRGDVAVAKALIELGAKADATDASQLSVTAAMIAADRDDLPMVEALIAAGASAETTDKRGAALLAHAMASTAGTKTKKALLEKKSPMAGALAVAAASRDMALVKQLIKLGAAKNGEGKRAADAVCSGNDEDEEMWSFLKGKFGSSAHAWLGTAGTGKFCHEEGD